MLVQDISNKTHSPYSDLLKTYPFSQIQYLKTYPFPRVQYLKTYPFPRVQYLKTYPLLLVTIPKKHTSFSIFNPSRHTLFSYSFPKTYSFLHLNNFMTKLNIFYIYEIISRCFLCLFYGLLIHCTFN